MFAVANLRLTSDIKVVPFYVIIPLILKKTCLVEWKILRQLNIHSIISIIPNGTSSETLVIICLLVLSKTDKGTKGT